MKNKIHPDFPKVEPSLLAVFLDGFSPSPPQSEASIKVPFPTEAKSGLKVPFLIVSSEAHCPIPSISDYIATPKNGILRTM